MAFTGDRGGEGGGGASARVLAWDGPTRLFHWALVILVACAWISKKYGDVLLVWHTWNGYAILTLLIWRLAWGVVGGTTSRFGAFLAWPWTAVKWGLDFARGASKPYLGHNPVFGWVVVGFLVLLAAQATTGLFASDDIAAEGPLSRRASGWWVGFLTTWHHRTFDLILILIALHLLANLAHLLWKRENLNPPMIHGMKPAGAYADASAARPGSWPLAAALFLASGALVLGTVWLVGGRR
jgi:cytochrome b